jgi:hypothetical protein
MRSELKYGIIGLAPEVPDFWDVTVAIDTIGKCARGSSA